MIIKIKIKCLLKESPSFCCILVHRRHRSCNFVSSVCPILGEPKRSPKQRWYWNTAGGQAVLLPDIPPRKRRQESHGKKILQSPKASPRFAVFILLWVHWRCLSWPIILLLVYLHVFFLLLGFAVFAAVCLYTSHFSLTLTNRKGIEQAKAEIDRLRWQQNPDLGKGREMLIRQR